MLAKDNLVLLVRLHQHALRRARREAHLGPLVMLEYVEIRLPSQEAEHSVQERLELSTLLQDTLERLVVHYAATKQKKTKNLKVIVFCCFPHVSKDIFGGKLILFNLYNYIF